MSEAMVEEVLVAAVAGDAEELVAVATEVDAKAQARTRETIDALLGTLEAEEADLIRKVYGLDGVAMSLEEISQTAGMDADALGRVAAQVLAKLRQPERYPVAAAA